MAADGDRSSERPSKPRLPVAGRNWSRYLWMIVGGISASGLPRDHLWGWRSRFLVLGLILVLLVLVSVIAANAHGYITVSN